MRIVRSSILLGCLLAAAATAHAQSTKIYQWKDSKGVTHFTDTPPPPGTGTSRNIASKGGEAPAPAPAKAAESPQCANARYNQQLLATNAPVQETGADGKPKVLGAEDRASRKQLADAAVANFCRPPEPAADASAE